MNKLNEIKKSIRINGIIDKHEVKQLLEFLYADDIIDKDETEFLSGLNVVVISKENHKNWKALFVEAIINFLLEDETSPDVIDENKIKWILAKIEGDVKLDDIEVSLLNKLKSKTNNYFIV